MNKTHLCMLFLAVSCGFPSLVGMQQGQNPSEISVSLAPHNDSSEEEKAYNRYTVSDNVLDLISSKLDEMEEDSELIIKVHFSDSRDDEVDPLLVKRFAQGQSGIYKSDYLLIHKDNRYILYPIADILQKRRGISITSRLFFVAGEPQWSHINEFSIETRKRFDALMEEQAVTKK